MVAEFYAIDTNLKDFLCLDCIAFARGRKKSESAMAELDWDRFLYFAAVKGMFAMTALTFIPAMFITAPYGRHARGGWGSPIPARVAWFVMESPTLWLSALLFPHGRMAANPLSLLFLAIFLLHYIHRVCIYPFRLRSSGKPVPLGIAAMAFLYNCYNTYLQVRWISHYGEYTTGWVCSPKFLLGIGLFLAGMWMNIWADSVLLSLRKGAGDKGYKIPRGGLFEYVTCPNYFGEIVEWLGWAVMTWSPPGLGFFLYTGANLGPRAAAHHQWYLKQFPRDYPKSRKVLIPFIY